MANQPNGQQVVAQTAAGGAAATGIATSGIAQTTVATSLGNTAAGAAVQNAAANLTTIGATASANLQLAGMSSQAASSVGSGLSISAGFLTAGALIGALKVVLGPYRLAPDLNIKVDGLPGVKQLSGLSALKQAFATIKAGAISGLQLQSDLQNKILGVGKNIISSFVDGTSSYKPGGSTSTAFNSVDTTRYNPAALPLLNNLAAVQVFSTATTSTILYLAGNTGTSAGSYWWSTIQPQLASTATTSIQTTFNTAKIFTDGLCGVDATYGVITIEQILQNQGTSSPSTSFGTYTIVTPTLSSFANTLYNPYFINSATATLITLIADANTSTTTLSQLQKDFANFNTATQVLLAVLNNDIANQLKYITQANSVSQLYNTAQVLNNIKSANTPHDTSFYLSTINPNLVQAVTGLSALNDLQSINTATVAITINAFQNTPAH